MTQIIRGGVESVGDITLMVETTGNDNDLTRPQKISSGDWSTKPFLTIQAAIDALPSNLIKTHIVTVNVGAGTFAGFQVIGFSVRSTTSVFTPFLIQGTRQTATPAIGPSSGVATGGGGRTLVLTGAGWTVDDLVGRYVRITAGAGAGQILLIAKNTTDTIYFSTIPSPAFAAGSTFVIEDLATIISSSSSYSSASVVITRCTGGRVLIQDLKVASASSISFLLSESMRSGFIRCVASYVTGASIGFNFNQIDMTTISNCGAVGPFGTGFQYQGIIYAVVSGFLAYNCSTGINLSAISWFFSSSSYLRNCSTGLAASNAEPQLIGYMFEACSQGLSLEQVSSALLVNSVFDNCTSKNMSLRMANLIIRGTLTGTGSTGFGMNAKGAGNVVSLESTPTVSGTLGGVTVDGTTDFTWAALASSDNYTVDTVTGARIHRR